VVESSESETSTSENAVRTVPVPDDRPLEIACDESGYEGEKLIGGTTDVFAHASVTMDLTAASECVQALRDRIRSPALEYKANHVLRTKHRSVLTWLLGPAGPLIGRAHVYLVEKSFLIVMNAVQLLLGEPDQAAHASDAALAVYRAGRGFDPDAWRAFLTSANDLMRIKDRQDMTTSVDAFFRAVADLRATSTVDDFAATYRAADEVLAVLSRARPRAEAFRSALHDGRDHGPAMDPLIPAIVRAVDYWSYDASPVAVIHDRQNTLSGTRVERLAEALRVAGRSASALGRVSYLHFVDSRDDPRVQVADFLAGVARKKASDELNGRSDDEITPLLRPYVDSMSIWADDRSWRRLRPSSNVSAGH
jgi:Protein of unknown function (DUF3800)